MGLENILQRGCNILINKVKSGGNKVLITVKHLFRRLVQSPLLLGWIIIGTIIEIIQKGYQGFIITIINLILLTLFTIIIKMMTDNSPVKLIPKLKHPKFELISGMLLYIFLIIEVCIFWGQAYIPFINSGITNLTSSIGEISLKFGMMGVPDWILGTISNALAVIVLELVPIIILFVCWGYGLRKMGFIFSNLRLILVLVGVTIILGLPFKIIFQHPLYKTIITFFIMIFVNGLPEELIFRAYLLPRFEVVLNNSINALVIVAILFNLLHVPSELARGMSIYQALLSGFSIVYPSGLIWGYLYLKTRSIVPGVIWHTSNTIFGIIFLNL